MLPTFDSVPLVCEYRQISVKFSMNGACRRNWPLQHDAANPLSIPVSRRYLVPSFRGCVPVCLYLPQSPDHSHFAFFFIHQLELFPTLAF